MNRRFGVSFDEEQMRGPWRSMSADRRFGVPLGARFRADRSFEGAAGRREAGGMQAFFGRGLLLPVSGGEGAPRQKTRFPAARRSIEERPARSAREMKVKNDPFFSMFSVPDIRRKHAELRRKYCGHCTHSSQDRFCPYHALCFAEFAVKRKEPPYFVRNS
ncbi:MAG: hypothetical protein GF333_04900 [Candidatus Omnitrophica bacterium]|nr:hypothetical protein [Candidatus Omnitrophota bacterium]